MRHTPIWVPSCGSWRRRSWTGLDPAVRAAAAAAQRAGGAGKCQQVWCPVCALAALVNGEQHPLLTVIAEHSVALLAVVRAMAERHRPDARTSRRPPGPAAASEPPTGSRAAISTSR